jgi:hypothetical protein
MRAQENYLSQKINYQRAMTKEKLSILYAATIGGRHGFQHSLLSDSTNIDFLGKCRITAINPRAVISRVSKSWTRGKVETKETGHGGRQNGERRQRNANRHYSLLISSKRNIIDSES